VGQGVAKLLPANALQRRVHGAAQTTAGMRWGIGVAAGGLQWCEGAWVHCTRWMPCAQNHGAGKTGHKRRWEAVGTLCEVVH
jgi:hypothetical protein